jgi:hypothetical protein
MERLGEAGASVTSLRGATPRWQKTLAAALIALVAGFLVAAVATQWSKLPDIEWRLQPLWLAACVAALTAFQWVHAELWAAMLHALGSPIPTSRARAVWSVTLLARYVPTNLALAVSRMALAEREGVPKRVCAASIVYELGLTFAAATAVGAYFVVDLPDLAGRPERWAVVAAPLLAVAALDPAVFHRLADGLLRRLGRDALPISLSRARVAEFVVLFVLSFALAGAGVLALAQAIHGIDAGDTGIVMGAYAVGFAASVMAFVLPGGLGAREAAMTAALSPAMPVTVALAVAVGVRLVQMAVEVGYAAVTPLLARRAAAPLE